MKEWSLVEKLEGIDHARDLLSETMFLGSLITGGASLISGFLGMKGKEDQRKKDLRDQATRNQLNYDLIAAMNADVRARAEAAAKVPIVTTGSDVSTSSVDIAAMMKGAEASGFNPVTFLRNGGLAAYAKSTRNYTESVTGSRAMEAALAGSEIFQHGAAPSQMSVPSMGEVFGNALTTGAGQYVSDMNQQQQNNFQMQLMNAQLQGNNRRAAQYQATGGKYGTRFGDAPKAYLQGPYQNSGGPTGGAASLGSKSKVPDLYMPYIDNSASGGGKTVWLPNPDIADSEQLAAALAGTSWGNVKQPQAPTYIDQRKSVQFVNPAFATPGRPQGATLGDIGNALSKYFEPWWNQEAIIGTSH